MLLKITQTFRRAGRAAMHTCTRQVDPECRVLALRSGEDNANNLLASGRSFGWPVVLLRWVMPVNSLPTIEALW